MSSGGIPEDVRRFLIDYIDSLELLEVLVLMRKTAPRDWSPGEVAAELRTAEESSSVRLRALASAGLLQEVESRYSYSPNSSQLDRTAGELDRLYPERRFTIIEIIFSKPSDKVRSSADAFRIGADSDE